MILLSNHSIAAQMGCYSYVTLGYLNVVPLVLYDMVLWLTKPYSLDDKQSDYINLSTVNFKIYVF